MSARKIPGADAKGRGGDEEHDEAVLFRRLMADAKRLQSDKAPSHPRRTQPRATFARRERREVLSDSLEVGPEDSKAEAGGHLEFRHPSVSRITFRRLARGHFSRQAELDLHGLTAAGAREALGRFIAACVEREFTCVRVIHGKGRGSGQAGPVLKRLADQWLRRCRPVLAFVTARPVDGGSGALYVLLRREH